MIVFQGKSPFSGAEIAVVATGLARKSANPKTGPMVQLFSLPVAQSPLEITQDYRDGKASQHDVCGTCPFAGFRGCYVAIQFSVMAVWKALKAGSYKTLDMSKLAGKAIRFGAWGEPVVLPLGLVRKIVATAQTWSGYTHAHAQRWAKPFRSFFMASVETVEGKAQANAAGWRTFRIIRDASELLADEVICPATVKRERPVTCATCGLCRGTSIKAKNVAVVAHGGKASREAMYEILNSIN